MPKKVLVFDCHEMPKDVKDYFFKHYGEGKCNDVYIDVWIEGSCNTEECENSYDCDTCSLREYDIVEKWLLDNGATDEVIVKRWW